MKKKPKPRGRWVKVKVWVNVYEPSWLTPKPHPTRKRAIDLADWDAAVAIAVPCVGRYWKRGK
jgi:hypothetical protein